MTSNPNSTARLAFSTRRELLPAIERSVRFTLRRHGASRADILFVRRLLEVALGNPAASPGRPAPLAHLKWEASEARLRLSLRFPPGTRASRKWPVLIRRAPAGVEASLRRDGRGSVLTLALPLSESR